MNKSGHQRVKVEVVSLTVVLVSKWVNSSIRVLRVIPSSFKMRLPPGYFRATILLMGKKGTAVLAEVIDHNYQRKLSCMLKKTKTRRTMSAT